MFWAIMLSSLQNVLNQIPRWVGVCVYFQAWRSPSTSASHHRLKIKSPSFPSLLICSLDLRVESGFSSCSNLPSSPPNHTFWNTSFQNVLFIWSHLSEKSTICLCQTYRDQSHCTVYSITVNINSTCCLQGCPLFWVTPI